MQSDSGKQIRRRKARSSEDKTQVLVSDNKELATETGRQIELRAAAWSGPLPPPEALDRYEKILPGSAKIIFAAFEKQNAHRLEIETSEHRQEAKMQDHDAKMNELAHLSFVGGQKYGLIISCVCIAAALASVYLGAHSSVAIAFVGVPMATIVKSFLKK